MAPSAENSDSWRLLQLPFWPDKPDLWFNIIELQFAAQKVTDDEDKFNYVIVMLDEEYVHLAEDILFNRPKKDLYRYLKRKLLERVAKWPEDDSAVEKMADRIPSKYFRYLLKVSGSSKANEEFVVMVWKSVLPKRIRRVLKAIEGDSSTSELLKVADAVYIKETNRRHVEEIKRLSKVVAEYRSLSEKCHQLKRILKRDQFTGEKLVTKAYSRWHGML